MKKIKTMRGNNIDFDLLSIKQAFSNHPESKDVLKREKFVKNKKKRNAKTLIDEMIVASIQEDFDDFVGERVDENTKESEIIKPSMTKKKKKIIKRKT